MIQSDGKFLVYLLMRVIGSYVYSVDACASQAYTTTFMKSHVHLVVGFSSICLILTFQLRPIFLR